MQGAFKKIAVFIFIATGALSVSLFAMPQKKAQTKIEFSGTIIDNKSLSQHADSLAAFLPRLDKRDVYNNVKSGYSVVCADGKILRLDFKTVEVLWNDLKIRRGSSPLHSLKIRGMGIKLGADSIRITGLEEVK